MLIKVNNAIRLSQLYIHIFNLQPNSDVELVVRQIYSYVFIKIESQRK